MACTSREPPKSSSIHSRFDKKTNPEAFEAEDQSAPVWDDTPDELVRVKRFTVKRDKNDRRNALISWTPVEGSYGYNIYFGTAPDKLYHCITVNGDTQYDLRGLDIGTDYYFTIEALSETGRGPLAKTIHINP